MNSRSSVNESNLVNFSPDLASLNALDKEPLLSFPFDHLYACHSQSSDCDPSLTLDKNVEISTHCMVQPDKTIQEKDAEILSLRSQNKKLKELLIYHLDLIQQQNDVITNREKSLTSVQEEVDTLREKVVKQERNQTLAQRHLNPPPLFQVPAVPTTCTVTSASFPVKESETPVSIAHSGLFSSLNEILGTPPTLSFSSDSHKAKPFGHDPFDLGRPSEALPDLPGLSQSDLTMPSILDTSPLTPLHSDFNMIEQKLPTVKKEPKNSESTREPKYTVTTNSGNPIIQKIQRNRKRPSGIGSLSRMPKTPRSEPSTIYDNEIYSATKKAKMMNTYGKGKLNTLRYPYAGSLSDRLQLIDTTPTGEDPYQIGEAEMREQSPIPRLVLPKNNRVRVHTTDGFSGLAAAPSTTATRRIYDPVETETKPKKSKKASKVKTSRRKSSNLQSTTDIASVVTSTVNPTTIPAIMTTTINTPMTTDPDFHVKKENDISWNQIARKPNKTSLGDFSYGETSANLSSTDLASSSLASANLASSAELASSANLPSSAKLIPSSNLMTTSDLEFMTPLDITKMSFPDFFAPEPVVDENVEVTAVAPETQAAEARIKKRGARTTSAAGSSTAGEDGLIDAKRGSESKRGGRKRALSSASSTKREKTQLAKPRPSRGRGGYRGKRGSWIPVPPLTTRMPYHTALGHPDISWYLGHDPDIKKEDVEQLAENTSPNVEVPRWREMTFTSLESAEGIENMDDEVYRKRHQKLEAEERRQLRWHMRRVREQRHVERLRMRQRDPWTVTTQSAPPTYTVWPSPYRDLQLIEITDILPVLAFGEHIPKLPDVDFVLPWVKTSKAQKRSKRSKTLH